jgi:hypothetical protein
MVDIECICPPTADGQTRHPGGDTVTLKATLGFRDAVSIRNEVGLLSLDDPDVSTGAILATLTESYLLYGVESWSLVDEKGKPVPVGRAAIRDRLLTHLEAAVAVGEAADELYAAAVVLPLLLKASKSSPPTPTNGSTSAPKASRPTRPKRSSPSSTITSPMAATAMTSSSPAGVSS